MDNEAFQKLVQERVSAAPSQSTKELARAAVEAEFRQKRKRGRGGNDSDDDDSRPRRPQGDHRLAPTSVTRSRKNQLDTSKYRDRAQERREGRLVEEKESVEDLDKALVDALSSDRREARTTTDPSGIVPSIPRTAEEAQALLRTLMVPTSALGRELLPLLRETWLDDDPIGQDDIEVSPAGGALQRSTWTFSLRGHPGDRRQAWQVPQLRTFASPQAVSTGPSALIKATPVTESLLRQLETSLARTRPRSAAPDPQPQTVTQTAPSAVTHRKKNNDDHDDDEDDIFGNVGEYDPLSSTSAAAETTSGVATSAAPPPGKGSLFDNLLPTSKKPEVAAAPLKQPPAQNPADESWADLLVETPGTTIQSHPTRLVGFASSTGYGDGMDYVGDDDEDDDEEGKKKKKAKNKKKRKDSLDD